ncbi:MAG: HAD family hydrolase [Firmicutes bacterium]|nr:HAD family hydrolase [Bacillota bacterium]
MEILETLPENRPKLKAVLFDFDGTISTLRHGWENVMGPLMIEMITGDTPEDDNIKNLVKEYIDQSTGIQTIYQMQWLVETIKKHGRNPSVPEDPWWYKDEYNKRLMKYVDERKESIIKGKVSPDKYIIKGSRELLEKFKHKGIEMYVASGTDHPDVIKEVEVLGLAKYFKEIQGAPLGKVQCSKEWVLRKLMEKSSIKGYELAVIGDGRVEIALGREFGAITLGVASDEEKLEGINPIKRKRLVKAGAHAIVGDFKDSDGILGWLGGIISK